MTMLNSKKESRYLFDLFFEKLLMHATISSKSFLPPTQRVCTGRRAIRLPADKKSVAPGLSNNLNVFLVLIMILPIVGP